MGIKLFCNHERYEVIGWKYINIGKYDQKIEASIICSDCGKKIKKIIQGDKIEAFALVYEDKFGNV